MCQSDNQIHFDLKRLSSDYLLVEDTGQVESTWICFRKNVSLSPEVLNNYITDILKCCLTHSVDSYKIHLNRTKGAKLIKKVANRSNYTDLAIPQIIGLIWSALSVVHHFHIRIIPGNSYTSWARRKHYKNAISIYEKLLLMLLPNLFTTVIQALITFFNESKIWELESLIAILLKKVLEISKDNENVIKNLIESDNILDARCVLRVIYSLLCYIDWMEMDDSMVPRMLDLYKLCTVNEYYFDLRSGYEVCLRTLFNKMMRRDILKAIHIMLEWTFTMDTNDTDVIEYASLLEYAANLRDDAEEYNHRITDEIFPLLLELISSVNVYLNLLGCRVLFFLLNRNNNIIQLMHPRPFFKDVIVDINIGQYRVSDKRFLQRYHSPLHNSLMKAVINHGSSKINLECTFACIALIIVEVPCGYTASATVCLAMALQEYALMLDCCQKSYNIHACVMFIMTLVCYVHKAHVFYDYVNTILSRRAQVAPFLNPPLSVINRNDSNYFSYKQELFFEDWEARYGLWKCFIAKEQDSE
ncbi:PREDICTED: uncharacterized protein LOC108556851 [Nicrophorus vespilloides]|uniref:Uncharacterized protein LOC108556851 n=1 Tax=Nicrophorus vespilloides TaxID=110193 RepID=A0ABM1M223_NICVS|nr:PREDICTED: uncharacterized protein LOC108556851 [Nicrophorus vespilloides]